MKTLRPIDAAALLFFLALALVLVAPSLFSSATTVCAGKYPDTWLHMWAFWRSSYAIAGQDAGYLTSHVITYPGALREPIAAFDPLMSLITVPLRAALPHMPAVFDIMVLLGLVFTGLAGYALSTHVTGRRAWGLVGGAIAAMNPFVYRQIVGGFVEYAWWGVVPLAVWLYLRAIQRPTWPRIAWYVVALITLLLWSVYCSACFIILAGLALLYEGLRIIRRQKNKFFRLLKIQFVAGVALLPLLVFWVIQLRMVDFKGISWGRPFPIEQLREGLEEEPVDPAQIFLPWRALYGSVDLGEALSLAGSWPGKNTRIRLDDKLEIPQDCMPHAYYESVFGREWLLVIVLAAFAFLDKKRRIDNLKWLWLATLFFILALGPALLWSGETLPGLRLPYAFFYRWLPGFSRLVIPGRFFLGTILCLTVLAVRGCQVLASETREKRPITETTLALVVVLWFMLTGPEQLSLRVTPADVSPVYHSIAAESGDFALLELPLRGDIDYRMYAQCVHQHPIFKGSPAIEWTDESGTAEIYENRLVQLFEQPSLRFKPDDDYSADIQALSQQGFRYLLLHADGYENTEAFEQDKTTATLLLGDPMYNDAEIACWPLRTPIP